MQEYHCMYENHEDEAILGFCLNSLCTKKAQFCFKCLAKFHFDHLDDCIRFNSIPQLISQYIQSQIQMDKQLRECFEKVKIIFNLNFKTLESNMKQLENISSMIIKSHPNIMKQQIVEFLKENHSKNMNKIQRQFLISKLNTICLANKDIENEKQYQIGTLMNQQQQNQQQDNKCLQDQQEAEDYANTGKQLFEEKQYNEALWFLEESLIRNNQQADVMNMKGQTLDNLERYQESLECYNQAIKINPNLIQAYFHKGNTLLSLENFEDAVECYNFAIQLCINKRDSFNNLDKCYSNLGQTLCKMKKYLEAILAFEMAFQINQDPLYLRNKGDALLQIGKKVEAKKCYEDALSLGYQNTYYIREKLKKLMGVI